jgi:uncharacterized protein (TIGR00730 family)
MVVKNITVYCGSSTGSDPQITSAVIDLAQLLVKNNITLVYGGGRVGLMGLLADNVIQKGGTVIGIIPQFLADREVAHTGISELHLVENMHERKMKMIQLADAFITLPGGLGSMEELFEVLTWKILKQHNKPVGLLNTNNFYDHLLFMMQHMSANGFTNQAALDNLIVADAPDELMNKIIG